MSGQWFVKTKKGKCVPIADESDKKVQTTPSKQEIKQEVKVTEEEKAKVVDESLIDDRDRKRGWFLQDGFVCLDAGDDDALKDCYRIPIERYNKMKQLYRKRHVSDEFIQTTYSATDQVRAEMKPLEERIEELQQRMKPLQNEMNNLYAQLDTMEQRLKRIDATTCRTYGHDYCAFLYRQGLEEDGTNLVCKVCEHTHHIKETDEYLAKVRADICRLSEAYLVKVL